MKWHSGVSFQEQYSNEMVSILGPSAKHPTANVKALESLPWTNEELKEIKLQFNNLASIPNYPGHYIIARYTNFAFLAAFNDNADPADSLLKYINTINKEITRKRDEFDLEILEYVGQRLSEKRLNQVYTLLAEGEITIEKGTSEIGADGMNVVTMTTNRYTISSDLKNKNSAVFEKLIEELGRAADVNNRISDERQLVVLAEAIAALEEISESATLSNDDKVGLAEVISLMNDAVKALESYQE